MKRINIKNTKTIEEYIKIATNTDKTNTMYSYIKIHSKDYTQDRSKHTFNKMAFLEYLNNINIPKKYIKEVETYEE